MGVCGNMSKHNVRYFLRGAESFLGTEGEIEPVTNWSYKCTSVCLILFCTWFMQLNRFIRDLRLFSVAWKWLPCLHINLGSGPGDRLQHKELQYHPNNVITRQGRVLGKQREESRKWSNALSNGDTGPGPERRWQQWSVVWLPGPLPSIIFPKQGTEELLTKTILAIDVYSLPFWVACYVSTAEFP